MKRLIIINILIVVMSVHYVSAQIASHEFSVYAAGGLSTLSYQLSEGARNGGGGGDFGLGYTYIRGKERVSGTGRVFHEDWGIYTGLGFGFFNAKAQIDNKTAKTTGLSDEYGDVFELHTTLRGYKENHGTVLLNIPLMGQFQYDRYFAMAGFKLGIPLSGAYKSKGATLINKGWYERYQNWCTEERFAGFGEFPGRNSDGNMKFNASVLMSLEGGVKWRVTRDLSLYTGVYFDYGLNNFAKNNQKEFVNYPNNNPENFTTNSVLSVYTEKIKVMAAGVKVRLALSR